MWPVATNFFQYVTPPQRLNFSGMCPVSCAPRRPHFSNMWRASRGDQISPICAPPQICAPPHVPCGATTFFQYVARFMHPAATKCFQYVPRPVATKFFQYVRPRCDQLSPVCPAATTFLQHVARLMHPAATKFFQYVPGLPVATKFFQYVPPRSDQSSPVCAPYHVHRGDHRSD